MPDAKMFPVALAGAEGDRIVIRVTFSSELGLQMCIEVGKAALPSVRCRRRVV